MRSRKLAWTAAFTALATLGLAPAGLAQKPEQKGKRRPGARLVRLFKKLDTNKDGKISPAEAGKLWTRLSRLDTNKDNFVDKKEIAAAIKKGKKGRKGRRGRGRKTL